MVTSLVLAGSPMDTQAGDGYIKAMANRLPMAYFQAIVTMGGGRLRGRYMLKGWKNMHPSEHYWGKYIDLFDNITNTEYVRRARHFARWYEHVVDLPGRFYLQAVKHLFKKNRLARGEFIALGERISLKDITVPIYLLAGTDDDITTPEQVFNVENLLGTDSEKIQKDLAQGGHIGLFMGRKTLNENWRRIGHWLIDADKK
ncbi:DUF3141 domain-containing protein [Zhongshania marina]|nr:DUF3141 domain-containing protein [Marortus luteolus]